MAETISLEVFLGMNSDQLQAELIKSQNELKKFESQLKKSTNTAEIVVLKEKIAATTGTINNITNAIGNTGKKFGDATNALTNFSRIAQDAPYGLIGITNNLNPMLESFQRLSATEGGTKKAFQAMAAGLTGPAGIGIALAVVSSLAVTFGKDISNFVAKTINGNDAIKEHTNAIKAGEKAYMDAYTEIYKLSNAFNDYNNNLISKKELLKQYNDTLGDTFGKTNNVTEAENIWEANSENFIRAAVLRAAALSQIDKAAKKSSEAFEAQAKPKEAYTSAFAFVGAGTGGAAAINLQEQTDKNRIANQNKVVNGLKAEERFHLQIAKSIEQELKSLKQKALYTQYIGKELPKEITKKIDDSTTITTDKTKSKSKKSVAIDALKEYSAALKYELSKQLMDIEKYQKLFKDKGFDNGLILTYGDKGESADRKRRMADERKRVTGQDNSLGGFLSKDASNRMNIWKQESDAVDAAAKSYENFANLLANNVTSGLMSVFDAIEQGTNPLTSIAQMFLNIAKSIAAAVIQATIFEALLTAFPELKAIFRASGALQSAFGYSGPQATGGITNGPSMALVGEAGPEAIIPLSKLSGMLNTTFSAGAMSGGGGFGGGSFVLKGNDLVLALQRSNSSLNLRRGGI